MDKDLIRKWNSRIKPNDVIYHLGDFGNFEQLSKLNGNIILILGNYEKKDMKDNYKNDFALYRKWLISKGFKDVVENGMTITLNNENIYLTHDPKDCKSNCFNLFGHVHERSMCKRFGLNVGVDCFHMNLFSSDDVLFYKDAIINHYDNSVFVANQSELENQQNSLGCSL